MVKLVSNKGLNYLNMMNTRLNNCMMAEFIGGKFNSDTDLYNFSDFIVIASDIPHLMFYESWNWLMPVCLKWDRIDYNEIDLVDYEKFEELCNELDDSVTLYEIDGVYNQLVININWYNVIKNRNC